MWLPASNLPCLYTDASQPTWYLCLSVKQRTLAWIDETTQIAGLAL